MQQITLSDMLANEVKTNGLDEKLARLIETVAACGVEISSEVACGALMGVLGMAGSENVQGEEQKKLDVISNDIVTKAVLESGVVAACASEEMDHCVAADCTDSRTYLICYPGTVDAAIIMGTGHQSPAIVAGGRAIAKAAGKRHGFKAHSPRVEALAFGAYNKAFAPNRTEVDWLSASDNNVDAYIADPLCGQKASIGLFYEMLGGIRFISTPKNIASMNRNTPILFISGDKDPVGEMGKGVKRAYEAFHRAGVRDVELKLYKGLRHEILNEDCRAVVYNDLWSWIEKHL